MKQYSCASLLLLTFFSNSSVASKTESIEIQSPKIHLLQPHFYIGGKYGVAEFEDACGGDATDCDNQTGAFGAFVGYQFSKNFALEAGATSYGTPSAAYSSGLIDSEINGYEVGAKLAVPMNSNLDFFAKIGASYVDIEKKVYSSQKAKSSDLVPLVGVGLEYKISKKFSVRGEYQFIDGIGDSSIGKADINYTSIGLIYHFLTDIEEFDTYENAPLSIEDNSTNQTDILIQSDLLFKLNSSQIHDFASLKLIAKKLQSNSQGNIVVTGFTDDTGPREYNLKLSQLRAMAVADYLAHQGVDRSRITIEGKGEESPIFPNNSELNRAQNRRVEIKYDNKL